MKNNMPNEIWIRPQPYGGWSALEDKNSTKFDSDIKYVHEAQLAALQETIESQKQTHNALFKKIAVRDAVIEELKDAIEQLLKAHDAQSEQWAREALAKIEALKNDT